MYDDIKFLVQGCCTKLDEQQTLSTQLDLDVPEKIDENLWRNREQCEEILELLSSDRYKVRDKTLLQRVQLQLRMNA